jgi:hypothetical protein
MQPPSLVPWPPGPWHCSPQHPPRRLAPSPVLCIPYAGSAEYRGFTLGRDNGCAGDWIRVKGSGTFDPTAHTVAAKGSFVHYSSTGTVMCKGTWKATGFTSFTGFGTNAYGDKGGELSIVVTHYCATIGMIMTGIPMTVTSTVNAPAGSTYVEGTTVGDFSQPTGGAVEIEASP